MKKLFSILTAILGLAINIEEGRASTATQNINPPCDVGKIGSDFNDNGLNDADELCELEKRANKLKKSSKKNEQDNS